VSDKLQIGDEVVMVNCIEAESHEGRTWKVRSNPWELAHGAEVVLLEGFSGGFSTSCLRKAGEPSE